MAPVAFIFSTVLSVLGFLFLDPLCRFLGSDEALLYYCREYMIPGLIAIPFAVFGIMFQLSYITVVRPKWRAKTIIDSCVNGSSEMVSILAFSIITILFNRILMRLGGSDGVASLSIIWYAQGLFGGLFRGYINGISSVISYNLGRGDKERLSRMFYISVWTLLIYLYAHSGAVSSAYFRNGWGVAVSCHRRSAESCYEHLLFCKISEYVAGTGINIYSF